LVASDFAAMPKAAGEGSMTEFERKRDQMIEHLEHALALADELHDSLTGYLIEHALDEARTHSFKLTGRESLPR
jgi:DNA-binding ferritin-like protein